MAARPDVRPDSRTPRRSRSPYELTAGSALDDLHPALRRYFEAIPFGSRGYGSGVFEVVGTPRLWLRPVLALFAPKGVLFPVWEKNVPFTIVNAPLIDRDGRTAVVAVRRFHFGGGVRTMIDAITADGIGPAGLVDHLGSSRRFRIRLGIRVMRGELHLESNALEIRIGTRYLRVPSAVSPSIHLVERFDDHADGGDPQAAPAAAEGAQRVSVTISAPILGRLYEYTGSFRYEIRAEPDPVQGT
ncbi:DUF4166 domain-containing protein [Herbiconiux sp. P15]|uniref:DUF4166 domain-containing protein n=1 Tax=Herbiconiux liukaitaii TaxID=3342799 RepID=UPI0035B9E51F